MEKKNTAARALAVPANRFERFGRLGGMTAGIAGNMAMNGLAQLGQGQRPSMRDLLLTPRNVNKLAEQLAQMRGAAMKMGQMISMDTGDVLPPELAHIMARLRDDAHFMPPAQLKQVLNAEWPDRWLHAFQSFDVRPFAAASIGQVHKATLKDGRRLAIKVQYPGVAKSIDSDVANVGALIRMSGLLPKGFELGPYLDEARAQLHEETDYSREAAHLVKFGALMKGSHTFQVPTLQPDWSTGQILAMSFEDGVPIEQAADLPLSDRNRIAAQLIDLTLRELFEFGVMQSDPNFANYLYNPDTQKIVLLDFGAARDITPSVTEQYRGILSAGMSNDTEKLIGLCQEIGFFGPDTRQDHRDAVIDLMQTMFQALTASPEFDFSSNALTNLMRDKGTELAHSGFVPPPLPIDFLLVQRKLGGVFLLAKRLGAQIDVIERLNRYVSQDLQKAAS